METRRILAGAGSVALLLVALGWKRRKFITLGSDMRAMPTIEENGVFEFRAADKSTPAFEIQFIGPSPCCEGILKSSPDCSGVQVATCHVGRNKAGTNFAYVVVTHEDKGDPQMLCCVERCWYCD